MYILIVLYMGDVEFTKICIDDDMARLALADWCCDNWHDEDSSPEDFSTGDMIEWYFDTYEDYAYYRQPIQSLGDQPVAVTQGEDILLTPGMCRIVSESLGTFPYARAQIILTEEEEGDLNDPAEAEAIMSEIISQFE